MTSPRVCAHPECDTILSKYNDGLCCSAHESYNEMQRAGLKYGKVPEEDPVANAKGWRHRGRKAR